MTASGGSGASSHDIEKRSVGQIKAMARYPAQLMSQSTNLCQTVNLRPSDALEEGGAAGEELTGTL